MENNREDINKKHVEAINGFNEEWHKRRTSPAFAKLNCGPTPGGDLGLFPTYYCRECSHGYFTEIHEPGLTSRLLECTNCGHPQDLPVNHIIHLVTTGGTLPESTDDFNKRFSEHMDKVHRVAAQKLDEQLTKAALIPEPTVGRIVHIFPGERWELPDDAKVLAAIVMGVSGLYVTCAAFIPPTQHNIFEMATLAMWKVPHISMPHEPAEPCWDWPERS